MSLRINLNSAALTAHRMLLGTDATLSKSIERLSSGFRINAAADDPAGLVISEKLRAQVGGLQRAISNAGDAVNMVRTAEAALNEVSVLLRTMRDLAVHAANTGGNDDAAIAADQAQITQAIQSINKIADETMFGERKLLNGSAGIMTTITGTAVSAVDLSKSPLSADAPIYVNVTQAATKASLVCKGGYAATTDLYGVAGDMYLNGVKVTWDATATVGDVIFAINAETSETGVVASFVGGAIQLDQMNYGSGAQITLTDADEFTAGGTPYASAAGIDAHAIVTTDGVGAYVSDGEWVSGSGLVLQDSTGDSIVLKEAANTVGDKGAQGTAAVGTLVFQVGAYAGQTREVNINAISAESIGTIAVPGESVGSIDVSTPMGATNAIMILDAAIRDVSTTRADLGALQKQVLESSITSLTIAKENIAASESTIRDTDMAAEVINLTRNQILQQAGVAMLAQANQTPQTLLALLK